ncbi:MAG: glycosyltransferase family 2 protein [Chlamydiia bacterium]|nr:glycosyltransferase family 2 protein [Chlamydiia bacterium]
MKQIFSLILIFLSFSLYGKETICLNMIVKDESAVIRRCLDSVKPYIDYWVIVDTGSTDGTQEIIKEHMKDIPGELHERPWKNFGYNRTEALRLAETKADFLLFVDADDWVEFPKNFTMPPLDQDAYLFQFKYGGATYWKTQLVRSSLSWKWVGVLHEYLSCNRFHRQTQLEGPQYVFGGDGSSWHDPDKYKRHVQILTEALEKDPHNERNVFYLAQSYRDAGDPVQAINYYNKRARMGGWNEEVYWSLFQVANLYKALNASDELISDAYYKALRSRPHRPEPWYYLAELYNNQKKYDLAYATLKGHQYIKQPETPDKLFLLDWINKYGFTFQLSMTAYYVGEYEEAIAACDEILAMEGLPYWIYECTKKNREFPLAKLSELALEKNCQKQGEEKISDA